MREATVGDGAANVAATTNDLAEQILDRGIQCQLISRKRTRGSSCADKSQVQRKRGAYSAGCMMYSKMANSPSPSSGLAQKSESDVRPSLDNNRYAVR